MSSNYLKWMKKGKGGSPKDGEGGSKKRPRSVLSREGSPSRSSSPVFTIVDDPPHSAEAANSAALSPPRTTFSDGILLQPGELWATGVSERLRAVICPPSRFLETSPLGSDILTDFGRMEEEALKTASMMQAFKALHLGLESSSSASAALSAQVDELKKERSELQHQLVEVPALKEKLKKAEDDLTQAQTDLTSTQNDLTSARRDLASTQTALADKDAVLKTVQAELDEARETISRVAIDAFDNAKAQAKLLNPDLITDGMDVYCLVKDGAIVPGSPGPEDGEGEGSEHGEGDE